MQTKLALKFQIATTPALIMASTVLRLPADALDELLARELACNPALEAHRRPSHNIYAHASQDAGDVYDVAEHLPARESAIDQLILQAKLVAGAPDQKWVVDLLYSLDEHGFLKTELDELAQALGASKEELQRALHILHNLHPLGIGARNIQECLLIQCSALHSALSSQGDMRQRCDHAIRIIEHAWDNFLHQRDAQVAQALGIAITDVQNARSFMREYLHPYPMDLIQNDADASIMLAQADMIVRRMDTSSGSAFAIDIPAADDYTLCVSHPFEQMLHPSEDASFEANDVRAVQFEKIKQFVEQARHFIDAVYHRWETLQRIGDFLAVHQADFFEHGPRCLKSLTRATLADALGVHESTISRAISDKTIQLPSGNLMPLNHLFDASLAPKEVIRQILTEPNKAGPAHRPPSDQAIVARLQAQGICLSRRTVAKYRQQMGLPSRYRN